MAQQQAPSSPLKRGQRHPLLFQQRFTEQIFWPSTLTIAVATGLLVWAPEAIEALRPLIVAGLVIATGVLLVAYIFRLRSFAQCRPEGLVLRLPFRRLMIPYGDLTTVRPTELARLFPPNKQRWTSRRYLERLAPQTVLVLDLEEYPTSPLLLRLWMNKYMICPTRTGLVLAVRDWMAFRRELDEYRARSAQTLHQHKYD